MSICLKEASVSDVLLIHAMQVEAFRSLLEKYQDFETNPGAETRADVEKRVIHPDTTFYLIFTDEQVVGAICVIQRESAIHRISPIFILPEFQGKGYAKQAMKKSEAMHSEALLWQLATIKEEVKLCSLYESLGYYPTGERALKEGMTLIFYEKNSTEERKHA